MPTRRVVLIACALAAAALAEGPSPAGRPPSIVLILADDLGIHDLRVYGRAEHRTPRLDRLAAEGTRFTAAYAAQPICSPSRAALLTGLTPARLHLTTFIPGRADARSQLLLDPEMRQHLPLAVETLAERLSGEGYATAAIGKWHLGSGEFGPEAQGFQLVHRGTANTRPSDTEGGKGEFDLTAAAERFLRDQQDRAFFLYLSHNTPHIPYAAQPARVARAAAAFEPVYAGVIEAFDESVGRVLDLLESLDRARDTIVIVTSDNGGLHVPEGPHARVTHSGPFRAGKGFLYEGGIRVPLIVRWPGHVPAGRVTGAPFINTDWMATLLELTGRPPAAGLDGLSQAALLRGADTAGSTQLFWHMPHYTNQGGRPSGAMRQGDWKLVEQYDTGTVELFDLSSDPGEAANLAPRDSARVALMRQALATWRRTVGAQENTPNAAADRALFRRLYVEFDPSRFDPVHAAPADWNQVALWREQMNEAVR